MDGQTIKNIRKGLGLSQTRFGELLGTSLPTVYRWERDLFDPGGCSQFALEALEKIVADGFGRSAILDMERLNLIPATGRTYLFIFEAAYGHLLPFRGP